MSKFKYNFFLYYGKLQQEGKELAIVRQNIADGLGVKVATFRMWEKTPIDSKESPFSKSDIEYCCKFLNCSESEFVNETETVII